MSPVLGAFASSPCSLEAHSASFLQFPSAPCTMNTFVFLSRSDSVSSSSRLPPWDEKSNRSTLASTDHSSRRPSEPSCWPARTRTSPLEMMDTSGAFPSRREPFHRRIQDARSGKLRELRAVLGICRRRRRVRGLFRLPRPLPLPFQQTLFPNHREPGGLQ